MKLYAFIMVFSVLLAVDLPKNDAAGNERAKLQGTWRIVAGEARGATLDEQSINGVRRWRLIFKGDRLTVRFDDGSEKESAVYLGEAGKHHAVDLVGLSDPDQGSITKGIWTFEGNDLKICYNNRPGDDRRPAEFKTMRDSEFIMFVLKPVKPSSARGR